MRLQTVTDTYPRSNLGPVQYLPPTRFVDKCRVIPIRLHINQACEITATHHRPKIPQVRRLKSDPSKPMLGGWSNSPGMGSNSKGTGVRTLVGQSDWTVSVSFGDPRYNLSMREKKLTHDLVGRERERDRKTEAPRGAWDDQLYFWQCKL